MAIIEILKSILFGIIEGITEWLPISSTGHLILLNDFIKLKCSDEFLEMFNVVIQLGAIMRLYLCSGASCGPSPQRKTATISAQPWLCG